MRDADLGDIIARFARDADAVDRGERDHRHVVESLRESGLLTLETTHLPDIANLLSRLGRGCVSTSLALTMHMVSLLYMSTFLPDLEAGESAHIDALLTRFRKSGRAESFIANCYAEPGSGAFVAGPATRASRDRDRWILSGRKFGSFADAADFLQLHARDSHTGEIVQFLIPADLPGISKSLLPPMLGVRAAAPMEVVLEEAAVDDCWRFGPPGMFAETAQSYPFATLLTVAPYIGAAEAALEAAVDHARSRKVGPGADTLLTMPLFRATLAECFVRLESARALFQLAASGGTALSPLRSARIDAAKIAVATMAPFICQQLLQVCGARGLMDTIPLGRLLRDVQAAAHHPPSLAEAGAGIVDMLPAALEELAF